MPFGYWTRDGAAANTLTSDGLGDNGNGPTFCDALVEVAPVRVKLLLINRNGVGGHHRARPSEVDLVS